MPSTIEMTTNETCACGAETGKGDCWECECDRDFWEMSPADYEKKWTMEKILAMKKADWEKTCVLCEETYEGYGNNARPLAKGQCCDACNIKVIVARMTTPEPETEVKAKEDFRETLEKVNGFVKETWETVGSVRTNVDRRVLHHALLTSEMRVPLGDQTEEDLLEGAVAHQYYEATAEAMVQAYPTPQNKMRYNQVKQEGSRLAMADRLKKKAEARKAKR